MRETDNFIFEDDTPCWWRDWLDAAWYRISDFFKSWIYPGYYMRNLLFRRYDRVKLPQVKPYEYAEPAERIKYAVFEMVCDFVDSEEKHPVVEWYGEYGHKIDGEYVMDIAKGIREWWRVTRDAEERKYYDFLNFYATWVIGKMRFHKIDEKTGVGNITFDKSHLPKFFEKYLEVISEDEWAKFDAVCGDRRKIMDEAFMRELCDRLETGLGDTDDKYLHDAIKIRQYLWT